MFSTLKIFKGDKRIASKPLSRRHNASQAEASSLQDADIALAASEEIVVARPGVTDNRPKSRIVDNLKDVEKPQQSDLDADFAFMNEIMKRANAAVEHAAPTVAAPTAAVPQAAAPVRRSQAKTRIMTQAVPTFVPAHKRASGGNGDAPVFAVQNGPRSSQPEFLAQAEEENFATDASKTGAVGPVAHVTPEHLEGLAAPEYPENVVPFEAAPAPATPPEPLRQVVPPQPAPTAEPVCAVAPPPAKPVAPVQDAQITNMLEQDIHADRRAVDEVEEDSFDVIFSMERPSRPGFLRRMVTRVQSADPAEHRTASKLNFMHDQFESTSGRSQSA